MATTPRRNAEGGPDAVQVAHLQAKVRSFAEDEVFEAAETLGSLMVSLSAAGSQLPLAGPGSHLKSLVVFADALKGKGETRRAIDFYHRALVRRKNIKANIVSVAVSSLVDTDNGKSWNSYNPAGNVSAQQQQRQRQAPSVLIPHNPTDENERTKQKMEIDLDAIESSIRFSIARCHSTLKEQQEAIKMLESIPVRNRTASMKLWLGQLYEKNGMDRPTLNAYKEGLEDSPYCLPAISSLLHLGLSADEIMALATPKIRPCDIQWLRTYVEAHAHFSCNQFKPALAAFSKLSKAIPNNKHVLVNMARLQAEIMDDNASMSLFQKARAADPKSMEGMDDFAMLCRHPDDLPWLNSLARDLIEIDLNRAEPWIAEARYCELRGDIMTALNFAQKAMCLDRKCAHAHLIQGRVHVRLNCLSPGVNSFYRAYSVRRSFSAYQGLVDTYLAIPKISEALRTAKEALQLMPKDPRAVLLVGRVLSRTTGDGKKKASKAYVKALKLDPRCHDAAIALADLYLVQHKSQMSDLQPAIDILSQTIQHDEQDYLHVKLGELYTAAKDYGAAMTHFHNALSITPDLNIARIGMERLERILRGESVDEDGDFQLDQDQDEYTEEDF